MEETSKPPRARAEARCSPSLCRWRRLGRRSRRRASKARLSPLYRHRHRVSTTQAERRNPAVHVAANHFVDQGHEHAGATGADWMSECDRASVHIHSVHIEVQFAANSESLHGESLVQFVEIDIVFL